MAVHARAWARRPLQRRQILLCLALRLRHVLRLRLGLRVFGALCLLLCLVLLAAVCRLRCWRCICWRCMHLHLVVLLLCHVDLRPVLQSAAPSCGNAAGDVKARF